MAKTGGEAEKIDLEQKIIDSKILIVDDDVSLGMTLEEVLKENDYHLIRFISDARKAEETYGQFRPDLVMLDLKMPHLDGFEVMQRIRGMNGKSFVPILVLTGEADETLCARALGAGATDFLCKPYKIMEVLARIQNLLRLRALQSELENKNDFLEEKVKERTDELRQAIRDLDRMHSKIQEAYIETIYRLTRATEYKDQETANHVKRLSLYAAALGRALKLGDPTVELLLYASPMHDVGKIGIPDSILFKNEALNEEEWKIMKTHPVIGYEILKDSKASILKMGAVIALNHHERWDGSGYPRGLKGEAIPLEARILALVDVYDALRSKRHYKESYSHTKASKIILEGDGRVLPEHFDPHLLEVFKRIHHELERIFDENSD